MGDNHYDSDTDEYYNVNLSDICDKCDGTDKEDYICQLLLMLQI